MRTLIIFIITFNFLICSGQTKTSFVFYDACNEEYVQLPYNVWDPLTDSTWQVASGHELQLEPGYYQVQLEMIWDDLSTGFWFDINVEGGILTDTLFLQRARFYGPMALHSPPEEFKYYYCDELCNGTIEDVDWNGRIRFKGRFRKGRPIGNLKYFNSSGERTRTEVYSKGQLVRIR